MRTIEAAHYVPKPGGGLASPGEILEPEIAARFSDAQIEWLLKAGAIVAVDAPQAPESAPAPEPEREEPDEGSPREVESEAEEAEEDEGEEAEPPEIDILDGIVQPESAAEEPTEKPKRAGRRKAK